MVSAFFASELWPFLVATALLLGVALMEAFALFVGVSPSHWFDGMLADVAHTETPASAALGWLHVGKVPILALIVIFLSGFALTGFAMQFLVSSLQGMFVPPLAATAVAAFGGVASVRMLGGALARITTNDDSTAVPTTDLVGRIGVVVIGTASAGRPAEARIHDQHGAAHYVMVEPDEPGAELAAGASVLLVRHLGGRRFHAILNPKPELL